MEVGIINLESFASGGLIQVLIAGKKKRRRHPRGKTLRPNVKGGSQLHGVVRAELVGGHELHGPVEDDGPHGDHVKMGA
jgi:hypothetical protein